MEGFYAPIYNNLSPAHHHCNFRQKLHLRTSYSIVDIYQMSEPAQSNLHVSEGPASRLQCCHLKGEMSKGQIFAFELS